MGNIKNKNCIIYNSKNGDRFIVINTRTRGHCMIFTTNNDGLFYNNTVKPKECTCSIPWRRIESNTLNANMIVQR